LRRASSQYHHYVPPPISGSYWLIEGQVLAGEYPGTHSRTATNRRLASLLFAGIRSFIDLTSPDDGLGSYEGALATVAMEYGFDVRYRRMPIRDLGTPTTELMSEILGAIRTELAYDRPVYVHCWGGIGRTGTVAGCWLVDSGLSFDAALSRIATLRLDIPSRATRSPETDEQCDFIRAWSDRMGAKEPSE
jgi:protein-tyrosine phosphatase